MPINTDYVELYINNEIALQNAQTQKLKINAHLSLADALADRDLHAAYQHFSEAGKMLVKGSSYYLDRKLESVRQKIEGLGKEYFLVSCEEIDKKRRGTGLRDQVETLEKWAIRKALEEAKSLAEAAEMLDYTRQGLAQKIKRYGL
jgi:transcriptional regulator with GAF, ATPase, and Fis domain